MKMNRLLRIGALVSFGCVALSGCSMLNVGEEHFSCDGMPGSVYCHSARDVYEKTNDGVVPSPVGKEEGSYNKDCTDCIRAEDVNPKLRVEEDGNSQYAVTPDGKRLRVVEGRVVTGPNGVREAHTDDEIINNYVSPALPDNPVPIRTPSQVMRIWIAPYVDTTGDLIAPGFVYTEVEQRRWIYPSDENMGSKKSFNPLRNLGQENTYNSPNSYSNPTRVNTKEREHENSLLKFRKNKEESLRKLSNN